jgi:4-amino-4-deoxychorismate lyase
MEWNDEGIAEGLVLNTNGQVIEGTMSNIFSVTDNHLYTPELSECGVSGITRSVILDIAKESGLPTSINHLTLDNIRASDELFFCNSIIGIWPVAEFEQQKFKPGPVTRLLQDKLGNFRD